MPAARVKMGIAFSTGRYRKTAKKLIQTLKQLEREHVLERVFPPVKNVCSSFNEVQRIEIDGG